MALETLVYIQTKITSLLQSNPTAIHKSISVVAIFHAVNYRSVIKVWPLSQE